MKKYKSINPNADFHVSLKFIFKDRKGRILILKTHKNSSMAGFYDFPGGRIQKNEILLSFSKTIKREINEELGRKVSYKVTETPVAIGRHSYVSKIINRKRYILLIFFEAKFMGGKIVLSDEHEDYAWINLNKKNYKKYFVKGPLEGVAHYLTHRFF